MKIEKRENVKGVIRTVVFYNNERYLRLQKSQYNGLDMKPVVEWKKEKTNHLVKADKFKVLEEKFSAVDTITKPATPLAKTMSSGSTVLYDFKLSYPDWIGRKSYEDKKVDAALIEECKASRKLSAVKMYKDFTGLGLKESKDYVDALYSKFLSEQKIDATLIEEIKAGRLLPAVKMYKELTGLGLKESKDYIDALRANLSAEQKWDAGMALTKVTETREQKEIAALNRFFESNAKKKQFISDAKHNVKEGGKLFAVKTIKDKTGWGLYESKLFFDTYVQ